MIQQQEETVKGLNEVIHQQSAMIDKLLDLKGGDIMSSHKFCVANVILKEQRIKGVFKYYTGLTYARFLAVLDFLLADSTSLVYDARRSEIHSLTKEDCLFLTLCRLRQNFGLKDLCVRFGISPQAAGSIFNAWTNLMFLKFGQLSIWPHRDIIINSMPAAYKNEFPNSLIIIDGTELKTEKPTSLSLQSQLYSDYKSSTTLKGLVGCDPCGSLMFVSELFTGSISDKEITERSGFYDLLRKLKTSNFVIDGDAVMADKGFTIGNELQKLDLNLNIPPFACSSRQLSPADMQLTQRIARHRVHIERLIARIKSFKIISHKIPASLFKNINKIWTVCCFLTLFQDGYLK